MTKRLPCAVMLALVVSLLSSGCAVNGLAFVRDDRVRIREPKVNEAVTLPLTVSWTADDYDGYFVVFFDRSPMRPGQSLRSLVPEGDPCRADPACPDADWLADRNVYVTKATSLEVRGLSDRRENNRSKDRHDLTIVLLNDDGERSGESSFTREFIVEREH